MGDILPFQDKTILVGFFIVVYWLCVHQGQDPLSYKSEFPVRKTISFFLVEFRLKSQIENLASF